MGRVNTNKKGEFKGVVGRLVFTTWKGIPIVKTRPRKSTKPPTARQLLQRQKIKVVMRFLSQFSSLINYYFDEPTEKQSRQNLAISYYLNQGLHVDGNAVSIDPDKVILTKGGIRGIEAPEVSLGEPNKIKLSWRYTPEEPGSNPQDRLYVALYAPALSLGFPQFNLAQRSDGQATFTLPLPYRDTITHLWAGFIAHDNSQASWSVYLGALGG